MSEPRGINQSLSEKLLDGSPRNITVPPNIVVGSVSNISCPHAFDFRRVKLSPIIAIFANRKMKGSNVA
jgi:hypothetical protein